MEPVLEPNPKFGRPAKPLY